MPLVDRRVILQAWVSAGPGCITDAFPQITGLDGACHLAVGTPVKFPIAIVFDCPQKIIRDPHRIV